MNTREVLVAARALIATPEQWLQGRMHNVQGTRHCALGAVFQVAGRMWNEAKLALNEALPEGYSPGGLTLPIAHYNDSHTHAEVLALFDRAIAAAEPDYTKMIGTEPLPEETPELVV